MSVRDAKKPRSSDRAAARRSFIGRKVSRASVEHPQGTTAKDDHFDRDCNKLINEINSSVACLRDLLIHVGQVRDGPELRDKIRKTRRQCVESCRNTNQILLPQVRSDVAEGIPVDNQHFVHLFCLSQLLVRELIKCRRLVGANPVDMTQYLAETRPGPSGMSVLQQLVLSHPFAPDFNEEELCSIQRDTREIQTIIDDMQEFMPREDNGKNQAFNEATIIRWQRRRPKATVYNNVGGVLCCLCKPNYL